MPNPCLSERLAALSLVGTLRRNAASYGAWAREEGPRSEEWQRERDRCVRDAWWWLDYADRQPVRARLSMENACG